MFISIHLIGSHPAGRNAAAVLPQQPGVTGVNVIQEIIKKKKKKARQRVKRKA